MLGNAAGKNQVLDLLETGVIDERRGDHERTCHRRRGSLLNDLEEDLRHIGAKVFFHFLGDFLAELNFVAKFLHHRPAGIFNARDLIFFIEGN